MNKQFYAFVFLVCVFFTSCGRWKHANGFNYEEYGVEKYHEKLKENSDCIVLDVRTAGEFSKGHMEHAINISYFGSGFRAAVKKLDKSKVIFMYCETQHRSPFASKIMKEEGFNHVIDLKGGFVKWKRNNMQIVK